MWRHDAFEHCTPSTSDADVEAVRSVTSSNEQDVIDDCELLSPSILKHVRRREETVCYFLLLILLPIVTSIPIDNGLIGSKLTSVCSNVTALELVIIMDASGSVGDSSFEAQKQFVADFIDDFDLGSDKVRVAIVQFADQPMLPIDLTQNVEKRRLQTAVRSLGYQGGTTHTGLALEFTRNVVFTKARSDVPKVGVLISDGQAQDNVAIPAESLRDDNVTLFAVGITNLINVNQLYQVTGTPTRVFLVDSYSKLNNSLSRIITNSVCKYTFEPGEPDIVCEADAIGVRATTKNDFQGNLFVKGHYHDPACLRDAATFTNARKVEMIVPFMQCDVRRWRSLNPRGIFVETTIIFMFHPWFMTKIDQSVKVQCFYMEAMKSVSVPLEVSMISTEYRRQQYNMPMCHYSIHALNGDLLQYAVLGQQVLHKWECIESDDVFGMLVHSCYADDGNGDRIHLIDANGCALDVHILGNLEYQANLRLASKEVHVFKYADRTIVQFQCQVTLCIKYDRGCRGITPPNCLSRMPGSAGLLRPQRSIGSNMETFDVISQQMNVLDMQSTAFDHDTIELKPVANCLLYNTPGALSLFVMAIIFHTVCLVTTVILIVARCR